MKKQSKTFETIYHSTYDQIVSYVLTKCGKINEVEDILQEIYMELFEVLVERGEGYIRCPEAFVRQLAKSKVYRYYSEKEQRRICNYTEAMEAMTEGDAVVNPDTPELVWEDALIDRLTAKEVMEYIAERDDLTKEIFYQHFFKDRTLKEIAGSIGVKESTVKNRLYRTLKELKGMKKLLCILAILLLAALIAKPACTFAKNVLVQMKNFFSGDASTVVNDLVHWEYDGPSIKLDAGEEITISTFEAAYENVEICLLGSEATETIGTLNRYTEYSFTVPAAGIYFIFAVDEEGKPVNITEKVKIGHKVKGTSGTIYLD